MIPGSGNVRCVKRKYSRLSEVQIQSSPDSNFSPSPVAAQNAFTVRLPQGASVVVPAAFDPDKLLELLIVIQEALA